MSYLLASMRVCTDFWETENWPRLARQEDFNRRNICREGDADFRSYILSLSVKILIAGIQKKSERRL